MADYSGGGYSGMFSAGGPRVYVSRGPMVQQGLAQLLSGTKAAFEASEFLRQRREEEEALRSPRIRALSESLMGTGGGPMLPSLPTPGDQAMHANQGAAMMGPTLGLENRPPLGMVPAAPMSPIQAADAAAQGLHDPMPMDGVTVRMGPIEMGPRMQGTGLPGSTSFSEDINVVGRAPPGRLSAPAPMMDRRGAVSQLAPAFGSMTEFNMFKGLAPYAVQRDVATMQTTGANQRTDRKIEAGATKDAGRMSIDLLKLAEQRRRLEMSLEAQLEKARLKGGKGGGTGVKELELLRKSAADAARIKQGAESTLAALDGMGASAAEAGSPLRMNYDMAVAEVQRTRLVDQQYRTLYEQALGQSGRPVPGPAPAPRGYGRPLTDKDDPAKASDEELLDLARRKGWK